MNIKKVEKQLKKISRLIEDIKEEGKASRMERDLLLSYLRDVYEKVLGMDDNEEYRAPKKGNTPRTIEEEKPSYTSPASSPIAEVVKQEVLETSIPKEKAAPIVSEPVATAPVVNEPIVKEAPAPVNVAVPAVTIPSELEELFEDFKGSELSDKLGNRPIADLTKCMGINEKIFTVQELFGGDTNLFNTTMSSLNNMNSLSEAKDYLVQNVAIDQGWGEGSKLKKADKFIRLISRRYN